MPRALPRNVTLGPVIATRKLRVRGKPQRPAELRIGTPRDMKGGDAYCPVQLVGIGDEKVRPIYGVDTVQAVQLAMRYLEALFMRFGDQLRWESQAAIKSLNSDPWALFEGAGLSEFLSRFAELCADHVARARPRAAPRRRTPRVVVGRRR
jgi:hypothetical protein